MNGATAVHPVKVAQLVVPVFYLLKALNSKTGRHKQPQVPFQEFTHIFIPTSSHRCNSYLFPFCIPLFFIGRAGLEASQIPCKDNRLVSTLEMSSKIFFNINCYIPLAPNIGRVQHPANIVYHICIGRFAVAASAASFIASA